MTLSPTQRKAALDAFRAEYQKSFDGMTDEDLLLNGSANEWLRSWELSTEAAQRAALTAISEYLASRRLTIEASIHAEVLAGNDYKEGRERSALAEINAIEIWASQNALGKGQHHD